ncbi:hypothetical protein, partial [Vibrio anguillarum]|uniref:hypothetical protein n=1 Tax=Vibrio anguillarum TaxID=55601 RepID=UPI001BE47C6E
MFDSHRKLIELTSCQKNNLYHREIQDEDRRQHPCTYDSDALVIDIFYCKRISASCTMSLENVSSALLN